MCYSCFTALIDIWYGLVGQIQLYHRPNLAHGPEFDMYATKHLTVAIKVRVSGFYTLLCMWHCPKMTNWTFRWGFIMPLRQRHTLISKSFGQRGSCKIMPKRELYAGNSQLSFVPVWREGTSLLQPDLMYLGISVKFSIVFRPHIPNHTSMFKESLTEVPMQKRIGHFTPSPCLPVINSSYDSESKLARLPHHITSSSAFFSAAEVRFSQNGILIYRLKVVVNLNFSFT